MNISGPAAVAKPEMLFYAPGDLTVTIELAMYGLHYCLCVTVLMAIFHLGKEKYGQATYHAVKPYYNAQKWHSKQ